MSAVKSPSAGGIRLARAGGRRHELLDLNLGLLTDFLTAFLRDEVTRRRGFERVIVALSGGVDSAVTTYLATRAFGKHNVRVLQLPYRTSDRQSLEHARLVVDALGVTSETIDITSAVDGYAKGVAGMTPHRLGNVMSRVRMLIGFDKSVEYGALQLGTGNKTERLFGYFTWHGDDAPPVNPLGDLYKTQVRALANHLKVPDAIVNKPPSADLVPDQSDEADLGISYHRADLILAHHLAGYEDAFIESLGFDKQEVRLVKDLVAGTHWKRKGPTQAVVSATAIDEFYLRPVDY